MPAGSVFVDLLSSAIAEGGTTVGDRALSC
jgi:hypothetical protein